jgi:ATP-binding cassette subfamily B protein
MAKEGKTVGGPGPRQHGKADLSMLHNPGVTIRRLMSYIGGANRILFLVVVLCILLSAAAGVAGSLFLQKLIDDYITPLLLEDVPNFVPLMKALVSLACIYLVGVVSTLFYNRLMAVIAHTVLRDIRDEMFSKMQDLPIRYFDTHTHGDIMSHYTNDTDTLRQMMTQSIPQGLSSLVQIVAVFCSMLFALSWVLTLVIVAGVILMLLLTKFITGKSSAYFVRQQHALGTVNGYVEEMIHGQRVVKVFCHEEAAKADFDKLNDALYKESSMANIMAQILMPITANFGNLIYVVIAMVGGALAIFGAKSGFPGGGLFAVITGGSAVVTVGTVASFLQMTKSFIMPISQISMQASSIIMALAGAERIFDLMDQEPEQDHGFIGLVPTVTDENGHVSERTDGGHAHSWAWKCPQTPEAKLVHNEDGSWNWNRQIDGQWQITPCRGFVQGQGDSAYVLIPLTGHVVLDHVVFGYNENKTVLHDISLFAKPGQKVAFVGATGAGKTTITNLLNRFYDIQEGAIFYDDIPLTDICKKDLRKALGIVLQDVNLFTGTVRENIRYGRLNATDEEVEAAAKLANAHDFILRLPQGYDTMLDGDGSSLSQGQRQLLSIARAAVADPPVMILDEATSSIDTRTEAIVQAGMDSLMNGRTVFVIAHRLSTVQNSDAIMVLDHGVIIERGSHEQLIEQKGKYYQLYTGAFELE